MKFDDVKIGMQWETTSIEVTSNSIKEFASEYDPQPMHLDESAAATGPFKELIASGWQTLCLTMKMVVEHKPFGDAPLIGAGLNEVTFSKPVFPNTHLFVRAEVLSKQATTKPDRGFLKMKVETINQVSGEVVLSQQWTVMITS